MTVPNLPTLHTVDVHKTSDPTDAVPLSPNLEDGEFLYDDDDDDPLLPQAPSSRFPFPRSSLIPQLHDPRLIIATLCIIIFILSLGGGLMAVPCLRLWEDILCHYHYNQLKGDSHIGYDEHISEAMCKGTEVQEQLNLLLAGAWFIGALPALFTTIPYGILADRIGRRPVFALSLIGMIMAGCFNFTVMRFWKVLPLQLIWAAPLFLLIGGGEAVTTMMFYAIGNDITTDSNRANFFLLGGCGGLLAELLGPTLASTLMVRSPWIPILLGMGLLMFGTSLVIFLPETLPLKSPASTKPGPGSVEADVYTSFKPDDATFYATLTANVTAAKQRLVGSTKITNRLPVILLLVTFITAPFGRVSGDMAMRYISNRYSWQLRQAGYLLSLRAFVNILLLAAILPLLSHFLIKRFSYSSKAKDLVLAKGSAVFLTAGAALLGFAPTATVGIVAMIIMTFGSGFMALTRSLITTLVDKRSVGQLYAAISVIETVCAVAAGPIQSSLYALGLKWKGTWQGLPYFSFAFIMFVSGIAVWTFGYLTKKELDYGVVRLGDDDSTEGEGDAESEEEVTA